MSSITIKEKAYRLGFDLCGIASADRFDGMPGMSDPRVILPGCRSVIVVACRFLSSTLTAESTIPYTIIRNLLSMKIDLKTIELSAFLEDAGFLAVPTGAIEPCNYNPEIAKSTGLISLKYAAWQAGLGTIGKNTLLISPEFGNMVWLGAVLTAADLEPDPVMTENMCDESCTICLSACPVGALDGGRFMDQRACWNYAFGKDESGGEWRIKCFACRAVCPRNKGIVRPRAGGKTASLS